MYSRDAVEVFALVEEDEPLTLDPEEKRAIRKRLERANELEKENRELREKLRRVQEELRRIKTSAPFLAASDLTAEAGGIPSSECSTDGPHVPASLVRPVARRATQGTRASGPSPTHLRSDSRWSGVGSVAPSSESPSRSVGGRSPISLPRSRRSSTWRSPVTPVRAATVGWSPSALILGTVPSGSP